jgi:hypothetical protein
VTKTGELGKDKPDPVTRFSSGSKLIEDCLIDALLRVEKAVEIVIISHGLWLRCDLASASTAFAKIQNVPLSLLNSALLR